MATIKLSGFVKVSLVRIFQADKLVELSYSPPCQKMDGTKCPVWQN